MVKKGRGFNIAAGVLDIIISVGFLALAVLLMFASLFVSVFGDIEESLGGPGVLDAIAAFGIVFAIGALALFVVVLILGILILKTANASPKNYYKKTGRMLGIAIVMTVFAGIAVFGIVWAFSVETLISFLLILVVVAMHWAGYGMAKHASIKYANEIENDVANVSVEQKVEDKKEEVVSNDPKLEKLEKLSKLAEAGIITEEDYKKMKDKIINE